MTIQEETVRQDTVTPSTQPPIDQQPVDRRVDRTMVSRATEIRPSGGERMRRWTVLIFGAIQIVIGLRLVLLLLDAREANALVSIILNISQLFVLPFIGIFRVDALHSGGSILDIAAIAALVGWSLLEAFVFWVAALFRRETTTA
ncbi:MAG: hypothetical protein ACRDF7_02945 [Candidatus Limnocylindrales bacterium]